MSKIVFINPIGFSKFDKPIEEYLAKYKDKETELEVASLARGPHHLEYLYYEVLVGPDLLNMIKRYDVMGFDAAIIGCFDDPFLTEAREIVSNMIVTAPEESALHIAAGLGNKFSIILARDKFIPPIEENVRKYGFEDKVASIDSVKLGVLEFQEDYQETKKRLLDVAYQAVNEQGAEVIILGCTLQFGFFEELQAEIKVPVIDVVLAPLKYAEFRISLKNNLNWTYSKTKGGEITDLEKIKSEIKEWGLIDQYKDSSIDGWE